MTIPHTLMRHIRLGVVLAFVTACVLLFAFLWTSSGGRIPLVSDEGYRVSASVPHVSNLAENADVMVAGTPVGEVVEIEPAGDRARVVMQLGERATPVHEGATLRVRSKTLLQETFLEITDGDGAALPNGAALPADAASQEVDLNDVLDDLDEPARDALAGSVRSLGASTEDSQESISRALTGLGHIGRDGGTAVDALASQSDSLERLTGNTAQLLEALDTRQGQIARLVDDADTVTRATAEGSEQLETVMRELPGVLDATREATDDVTRLSEALGPVAADLTEAAPELTAALEELPATAHDLRALLPPLDGTLEAAPDTLTRVPTVSGHARELLPEVQVALADVNPMLSYLRPYGRDLAGFLTTTEPAAALAPNGWLARLQPLFNEKSLRGLPLDTNEIVDRKNPYPAPGSAEDPGPFTGEYPRVEREESPDDN
ncbi:MCE family protein [Haloechinothrix sp. YIM 98757]|uniref:MCE family protein n=1 Tax=Haloechinothrix aidingensis TaxID=2752311 RepID=A0A838ABA1_9PSEU|nr:MlaD family protein [Haloechinothrix aidingensis]MBA0126496.1 MCE family protein [Haloechinothrix aidingensis]